MKNDPKVRGAMPALDLKHLIWILDWAREKCAAEIKGMELEHMRNAAFEAIPACTKWGYKDRAQTNVELAIRLSEYRTIFAWLEGAKGQAMTKSHEEFAQQMAEMFGRKK